MLPYRLADKAVVSQEIGGDPSARFPSGSGILYGCVLTICAASHS